MSAFSPRLASLWAMLAVLCPATLAAVPSHLAVPPGFQLTIYADNVPNARQMVWGDDGVLFVGSREQGNVYALRDNNGDGHAEQRWVIAKRLNMPSGVAFKKGSLYVAAVDKIYRFDTITQHLENPPPPTVLYQQLPDDYHHGWKYLQFNRAGELLIPVGMPCNICQRDDQRYGTILALNLTSKQTRIIAQGIRNSVGFAYSPQSGLLWFSDNGRDMLGDDLPPEEINVVTEQGEHFGFPYWHAGDIKEHRYQGPPASTFTPPVAKLQAHVAPLGMAFYQGTVFPENWQGLYVAEHGSWNRSKKVGYQVVMIPNNGRDVTAPIKPLVSGWLQDNGKVTGRPVDVLNHPDGSVLISDDLGGVIYKLSYQGDGE